MHGVVHYNDKCVIGWLVWVFAQMVSLGHEVSLSATYQGSIDVDFTGLISVPIITNQLSIDNPYLELIYVCCKNRILVSKCRLAQTSPESSVYFPLFMSILHV